MKMIADYDNRNPDAMKKLIGSGAKLSYFPKAVMEAAYKASNETNDSLAEANPEFKAILPGWLKYRREQASWFRVVEAELDNFTFTNVTK
jgi:TRAP-type mannitol/chloroaromatic compound transport system substrate-binding protein